MCFQGYLDEVKTKKCNVKTLYDIILGQLLDESQKIKCILKEFCESLLPNVLDEAQTKSQRIKEEIIQHIVSNEKTKQNKHG